MSGREAVGHRENSGERSSKEFEVSSSCKQRNNICHSIFIKKVFQFFDNFDNYIYA
jgi:hypothetical protein